MYKQNKLQKTSLERNESVEGETIEIKIERVTTDKEPLDGTAPQIYTERKDGVMAGYNIRTDRFDVAIEAMDRVSMSEIAKRNQRLEERKEELEALKKTKKDGEAESIQGTGGNTDNQ